MTRIAATIDLDGPGVQHGFLKVPHSTHDSAYGWIPVPITVAANGNGPSVLLVAGNHGDEYEGQIALMKLVRSLDPAAARSADRAHGGELSGRHGGPPRLADRRRQPQPLLPGQCQRHADRDDRPLHRERAFGALPVLPRPAFRRQLAGICRPRPCAAARGCQAARRDRGADRGVRRALWRPGQAIAGRAAHPVGRRRAPERRLPQCRAGRRRHDLT